MGAQLQRSVRGIIYTGPKQLAGSGEPVASAWVNQGGAVNAAVIQAFMDTPTTREQWTMNQVGVGLDPFAWGVGNTSMSFRYEVYLNSLRILQVAAAEIISNAGNGYQNYVDLTNVHVTSGDQLRLIAYLTSNGAGLGPLPITFYMLGDNEIARPTPVRSMF